MGAPENQVGHSFMEKAHPQVSPDAVLHGRTNHKEMCGDDGEEEDLWIWDGKLEKWKHFNEDTREWILCPDELD